MECSSSCSAWKGAAEPAPRQSNACSSNSTLPQFWAALNWVCHWSSVSHFPPGIIKSACKMVPKRENGAQIHTEKLQRGTFLKETSQQCSSVSHGLCRREISSFPLLTSPFPSPSSQKALTAQAMESTRNTRYFVSTFLSLLQNREQLFPPKKCKDSIRACFQSLLSQSIGKGIWSHKRKPFDA